MKDFLIGGASIRKTRVKFGVRGGRRPLKMDGDASRVDSEGPPVLRYRQRLEKSTGGEVMLMAWSPTMDLLAAALSDHSVSDSVLNSA